MGFFCFLFLYIYLYIYTHKYTPKHPRNYTCTGLISGQPDVTFVFAGLSFCSSRRREIKLPTKEEVEKSQVSGLPKTFIYLKGRETQSAAARREKSAFNEAVKTEIKQRGGVFFVLSVQEYDTHMHKLTQAGHCQDCHPMGHGLSVAPEPSRRRCRSEREAEARGTVVHLFPKEKKTHQTHPQNMHTLTKRSFLHQTSPIPSLGMVFPTQDIGECYGKDESKGLPIPRSPA